MNPTLYDVLGVSRDASSEEIRNAWREAADRFEPGKGATRQFRLFNEAAEVLLDPERREAYDATLGDAPAEARRPDLETPEKKAPVTVPGPPMPGTARATTPAPAGGVSVDKAAKTPKDKAGQAAAAPSGGATPASDSAGQTSPAEPVAVPAAASEGESTPARGVPWWVLTLLGVLTAVAVGFAVYFITQAQEAEEYQEALDRAPAAAESAAAAVLSYDYESLESDRDAAAKFLTEKYRGDYVETFDKLVTESATQTKAKVEAQVLASSAMVGGGEGDGDRDPDRIPVLLFVNQTTTSTASAEPSVALNRVRFDMVEVDGTWLVDGITSY